MLWINFIVTRKIYRRPLPNNRRIHIRGSAKEKARTAELSFAVPGALSTTIAEKGRGCPVAALYALSKWAVLDRPPFEKRCMKTGFSGATKERIASTAGVICTRCAFSVA
jgi:hypothetical protein